MLTPDDLRAIANRYHRTDWDEFDPTPAVFDIGRLLGHITLQAERIAAVEAAARAIVTGCRVPRGDYLGDLCRWCENTLDRDGHRPGCPAGILTALLEDA